MQEKSKHNWLLKEIATVVLGSEKAIKRNELEFAYYAIVLLLIIFSFKSSNALGNFASVCGVILSSFSIAHIAYARNSQLSIRATSAAIVMTIGIVLMNAYSFPKAVLFFSSIRIPINLNVIALTLGAICYVPRQQRIEVIKLKFLTDFLQGISEIFQSISQIKHAKQYDYALSLAKSSKPEKALAELEKLINQKPGTKIEASSKFLESLIYENIGDAPKALESCEKAIEIMPEQANYYGQLGDTRCTLGDKEGGIAAYKKGVELGDEASKVSLDHYAIYALKLGTNAYMRSTIKEDAPDELKNMVLYTDEELRSHGSLEPVKKTLYSLVRSYIRDYQYFNQLTIQDTIKEMSNQKLCVHYAMINAQVAELTQKTGPELAGRHLEEFIENYHILIYDELCMQLNNLSDNEEFNELWPNFFNARNCDIWNKKGKSEELYPDRYTERN